MAMSAILCCHVLAIGPQATSIRVIIIMTSHERHGVSNYQKLNCLFNSLFMVTSKKALSFAILILCEWNLPLTSGSSFFELFQKISLAFSCRNYILFLCYLHSNWAIVHLLLYTHYLLLQKCATFQGNKWIAQRRFPNFGRVFGLSLSRYSSKSCNQPHRIGLVLCSKYQPVWPVQSPSER